MGRDEILLCLGTVKRDLEALVGRQVYKSGAWSWISDVSGFLMVILQKCFVEMVVFRNGDRSFAASMTNSTSLSLAPSVHVDTMWIRVDTCDPCAYDVRLFISRRQHCFDLDQLVYQQPGYTWRVRLGWYQNGSVSKPCTPGEHQNSW
jgi:hypothetical protein